MTNAVVRGKIGFASIIDIVIFKENKLFANVEIKRNLNRSELQRKAICEARRISTQLNTALYIVCSPDELFFSQRQGGRVEHILNSTEESISGVLNQKLDIEPHDVSIEEFRSVLSQIISASKLSQTKKKSLSKILNENFLINNTDDGTYFIEDIGVLPRSSVEVSVMGMERRG